MPRCPNCGQETQRTNDWACRWCGYPLASNAFKKLDISYQSMLKERRLPELQPETEEPLFQEIVEAEESQPLPEAPAPETAEPEQEPRYEMPPAKSPDKAETAESEPPILLGAPPEPAAIAEPPPEIKEAAAQEHERREEELIIVTAGQMFAEYKTNAIAADARYQNQTVQISGIVDSVGRDMLDNPFVKLSSEDKEEIIRIRCTFPPKSEDKLLKLTAGQKITVRGSYDGYLVNLLLKDCVLIGE